MCQKFKACLEILSAFKKSLALVTPDVIYNAIKLKFNASWSQKYAKKRRTIIHI